MNQDTFDNTEALAIDAIVSDVGMVLFDFSIDGLFAFLRAHDIAAKSVEEFIMATGVHSYEQGLISTDDYLENVLKLCKTRPSHKELIHHWNDIFTPDPEMVALLKALRNSYRVYLLSNTNEMHWEFLENEHSLSQIADGAMTSFEVFSSKPDRKIFALAQKHFQLIPEKTVFVDDRAENIDTALSLGWHGIVHVDAKSTIDKLAELGVKA